MLILSDQTMQSMRDYMRQRFEDRVLAHVQKCFPDKCRVFGEPRTRQIIHAGIAQAPAYGFTTERQVVRFVNFQFMVRPDFDTSRLTPWARPILTNRRLGVDEKFHKLEFTAKRFGYKPPPPAQ